MEITRAVSASWRVSHIVPFPAMWRTRKKEGWSAHGPALYQRKARRAAAKTRRASTVESICCLSSDCSEWTGLWSPQTLEGCSGPGWGLPNL